jgi:hypothetical protein
VPEVNRTGQFAAWIKANTELHTVSLNKYGGLPFTPAEIRAKVMEFLVPAGSGQAPRSKTVESEPLEEVVHG